MRKLPLSALASVLFLGLAALASALLAFATIRRPIAAAIVFAWALASVLLMRQRIHDEASALRGMDKTPSPEFQPALQAWRATEQELRADAARLKDSRLQLEVLLEGMQDGVLGVDAAGRVLWTNKEMGRILDTHGLGAVIRLGRSLAHTLRDPVLLDAVQRAVTEQRSVETRSETLLPGRIFDVSAAPLPGGGAVVVLHDVTRSEALERTQREFVANVSHELRTPLTSILGYVETLVDTEPLQPRARAWLETVLRNANRMTRLTEDLLVLAKIEDRERKLYLQPLPAATLLEEAVRIAGGSLNSDEVEIVTGELSPDRVLADEVAVLQVLGNLLENAAKYGRAGGEPKSRVHVSTETVDGAVEFRVRDFGSGIAQEHQGRIFERFYRVDKARSRDSGGTGLGLAIARHLVEEQGGAMRLQSSLGQGSTFAFTLPLAPAAGDPRYGNLGPAAGEDMALAAQGLSNAADPPHAADLSTTA